MLFELIKTSISGQNLWKERKLSYQNSAHTLVNDLNFLKLYFNFLTALWFPWPDPAFKGEGANHIIMNVFK